MRAARRKPEAAFRRGQRGSVSVEFAVAMPALVILVSVMLSALAWARANVVATELAHTSARIVLTEGEIAARSNLARSSPNAHLSIVAGAPTKVTVTVPAPWGTTATASAHVAVP